MVKITKDTLEYLSIKSVYIKNKDVKLLCIPVQLYLDCWRIYVSNDNFKFDIIMLEILLLDNTIIEILCSIKKINDTHKQYLLFLQKPLPYKIQVGIKSLEKQFGAWEKRKGIRLEIGVKKYHQFGLKQREQKVVISGFEKDCILEDISMHGVKIKFRYPKLLSVLDFSLQMLPGILGLKLAFINPIFLAIEPVRLDSINTKEQMLTIGYKIKEPINISYINKILEYAKQTEYQYVFQQERR